MQPTWLSIVAIAVLVISTLQGTIRGVHKNLVDLVFLWGVILSFIFGFRHAYEASKYVTDEEIFRILLAGIGLLIIAVFLFGLLSDLVAKCDIKGIIGSKVNHGLGMVYGLVRGIFIIAVAWLIFISLASESIVVRVRDKLPGELLDVMAVALWDLIPETWTSRAEEIKVQVVEQTKVTGATLRTVQEQVGS